MNQLYLGLIKNKKSHTLELTVPRCGLSKLSMQLYLDCRCCDTFDAILLRKTNGGEGEIRTLETPFDVHTLSRRAP